MKNHRSVAFLIAAFALSSPAAAEVAVYTLGPLPREVALVSEDGYHYASYAVQGDKAAWSVDGRVTLAGGLEVLGRYALGGDGFAALNADGRVLLSVVRVPTQDGSKLYSPAANGKPYGTPYSLVMGVKVGRLGENAAFTARNATGCFVVSGAGAGPAFPDCPEPVIASDAGVIYAAKWQGRTIVYKDHQPIADNLSTRIVIAPDLSRFAGVLSDGAGSSVLIGTSTVAKIPIVMDFKFSDDGRHLIVKGGADYSHINTLIVDGKSYSAPGVKQYASDPRGIPFWMAGGHLYAGGRDLGAIGAAIGDDNARWIGFSRTGKHHALSTRAGQLIVDGEPVRESMPLPLGGSIPVFEGENEFHYIGESGKGAVALVCGTVDGSDVRRTHCARAAGTRRAKADAD